jgi:hypothetical protein
MRNFQRSLAVLALTLAVHLAAGNNLIFARRGSVGSLPRQSDSKASKKPGQSAPDSRPGKKAPPNGHLKGGVKLDLSAQREQRKQLALSMIQDVLTSSHRITPVEYAILAEVEAATLLWSLDRDQAMSLLKSNFEKLTELKDKKACCGKASKARRLRYLAFHKIAMLNPELLSTLSSRQGDKPGNSVSADWSEEARALISVATDTINDKPDLAAALAQQVLALGQVDWTVFLRRLHERDSEAAGRLALIIITQLADSPLPPVVLLNLSRFTLARDVSTRVRNAFFEAVAMRLGRDMRLDLPTANLAPTLLAARDAYRMAANDARWQPQFGKMVDDLETVLRSGDVVVPARGKKVIPMQLPQSEIIGGDDPKVTAQAQQNEITPANRDQAYRQRATEAAGRGNLLAAEEAMSKIEDAGIKGDTSLTVYGPFVRQAFLDSEWSKAWSYADRITDPLGRTLALNRIARAMATAGKDRRSINEVYNIAFTQLRRDTQSESVAKSYLILARSLSTADPDRSLDALEWAIHVLNRVSMNGELMADFKVPSNLTPWISVTIYGLHDEALDLTALIGPVFEELAKRDPNRAHSIALGILHNGVYSFAALGIARELLRGSNYNAKKS